MTYGSNNYSKSKIESEKIYTTQHHVRRCSLQTLRIQDSSNVQNENMGIMGLSMKTFLEHEQTRNTFLTFQTVHLVLVQIRSKMIPK